MTRGHVLQASGAMTSRTARAAHDEQISGRSPTHWPAGRTSDNRGSDSVALAQSASWRPWRRNDCLYPSMMMRLAAGAYTSCSHTAVSRWSAWRGGFGLGDALSWRQPTPGRQEEVLYHLWFHTLDRAGATLVVVVHWSASAISLNRLLFVAIDMTYPLPNVSQRLNRALRATRLCP